VSPVLAGLAVGIGVPILLFYVYGVVPVSLCRSGGCGVSTSPTGVHLDFDDDNEMSTKNTGRTRSGRVNLAITATIRQRQKEIQKHNALWRILVLSLAYCRRFC